MELDGAVLEAFIEHLRAFFRQELLDELEAADREAWEPVRRHLERTRQALEWTERRDKMRAADEQRREEILDARSKESA